MNDHSPQESNLRPHPLAAALIERLRSSPHASVLEIGIGSGRNRAALLHSGFEVHSADEPPPSAVNRFDAALSTHALLHGTHDRIAALVAAIAGDLKIDAPFYATFGSQRDARFGKGSRLAPKTYAPDTGDEAGVAHSYFDEEGLRELLNPYFIIESLEERRVDDIVGQWAHATRPEGSVHFFLVARNRGIHS